MRCDLCACMSCMHWLDAWDVRHAGIGLPSVVAWRHRQRLHCWFLEDELTQNTTANMYVNKKQWTKKMREALDNWKHEQFCYTPGTSWQRRSDGWCTYSSRGLVVIPLRPRPHKSVYFLNPHSFLHEQAASEWADLLTSCRLAGRFA